jgi:nucleoside-diphosphate-sugar epimerase
MAHSGDVIEVWGDGEQTRSFLYVDECIEGTVRLLRSTFPGLVNIGSGDGDAKWSILWRKLPESGLARGIFQARKECARGTPTTGSSMRCWVGRRPSPCAPEWNQPIGGSSSKFAATRRRR